MNWLKATNTTINIRDRTINVNGEDVPSSYWPETGAYMVKNIVKMRSEGFYKIPAKSSLSMRVIYEKLPGNSLYFVQHKCSDKVEGDVFVNTNNERVIVMAVIENLTLKEMVI